VTVVTSLPTRVMTTGTTPTPIVSPPTPVGATAYSERERAFSDPPQRPHPLTPWREDDDPLLHHWRQSPRRSSSLLRRLSRSGQRRSISIPGDAALRRTVSDPPPSPRQEDDDMVHVPEQFQRGVEMLRVSRKKVSKRICWIDPLTACVGWDSKSSAKCMFPTSN
jgi:hypothetical protein